MGMPHHVFGSNFPVLSVNLIPVPLSLTCLFMLLPHFLTMSTHHFDHPLLSLAFTPGSRPTSFTNLSHYILPSGLRTDSTSLRTRPIQSTSVFLVFSLLFFFVWFPAEIKLAIRQLLGTRKYSASYHIAYRIVVHVKCIYRRRHAGPRTVYRLMNDR